MRRPREGRIRVGLAVLVFLLSVILRAQPPPLVSLYENLRPPERVAVAEPLSARGPGKQTEPRLKLTVLPCTNIEITFKKFHPLLTYLKAATGLTVTITVPADLVEFETTAANGQVDFALQDPHTFRQLAHLFDHNSLVQTRALDGTTSQVGVVVVRRESGVTDLGQLRGKTVMFGPRISSPKWIAAKLLFESRGVEVGRDLKIVNGGCCEDIAFAVAVKTVDAGVICDHFLGQHGARQKELGVDPDSLAVIGHTAAVPTRVFAARRGLSPDTIAAITSALLQLDPANPEHAEILTRAEIRGFVKTTAAEYLRGIDGLGSRGEP